MTIDNNLIQSDIKENFEMYKRILDSMWEAVWIWDDEEKTVRANPKFLEIVEYDLDEIKWWLSYKFRDEESSKTVASNNEVRKEGDTSKYEWVLRSKNWNLIPVLCSWTPIPWWGTCWIHTDLREVKSLKEVEENLKQINSTKDEFISVVWHELRTPLTAIRWYVSMMLDWDMWVISDMQKWALDHTYNSTVRLIDLVNDMLSVSKIESWRMEYYMAEIEVYPLLESIHKDIKSEASRKWIKLLFDIVENNLTWIKINVDENKFKQAMLNILTNALKFTPSWWTITVSSKIDWDKVYFWIRDTWEGIPEDKIKSLFWKFTQVESALQRQNTAGLWLWLSLVKNFIEKFWSEVKVKSKVWEGSLFYFYIDIVK